MCRATRLQVDAGGERHAARVHLEDALAAGEVRRRDEQLAVEAARTEERRVEILDAVGRAHHDHLVAGLEPVELDEELVQRLVLLAVEAAAGARGADRVELVDEHDRRGVLARGVEELADAGGTEAGEHLDERGCALRVEARARLVGDRFRKQRLAGTGRPVEQEPLRHARAERREFLRVAEKVDDLLKLGFRVLDAGDVVERDRRLRVRLGHLRLDLRHQLDRAPDQVDEDREEGDRQPGEGRPPLISWARETRGTWVPSAVGWGSISTLVRWPSSSRCRRTGIPPSWRRSGASSTRNARRRRRSGDASTESARRPPTAGAWRCCSSTCRTPSARRGSSCSSRAHPDDNRRLCEFVYRNLGAITQIIPTLDTHKAMQVFHAAWLVNAEGRHPSPYTVVSAEDVENSVWWAADPAEQQALLSYVRALEAKGRYQLTIWPYHAMLGGIGHALVSSVEEAVFFHGIARSSSPAFQVKGDDPRTEHYSALGPEVGDRRNEALVDSPARLRRGRHRRPGEEPLRRLDGRRPARGPSPERSTCSRTAHHRSSSLARSISPMRPSGRSPRSSTVAST